MLRSILSSFKPGRNHERRLVVMKKYTRTNVKTTRCGFRAFRFDVCQTANLYLELERRQPLCEDACVLDFDYICPDYIVFFRLVAGNDSIYVRNVDPVTRWTPFSIDLSGSKMFLRDNITRLYNNTIQLQVVPFPTAPGTVFKLRNLRLRPHTAEELA